MVQKGQSSPSTERIATQVYSAVQEIRLNRWSEFFVCTGKPVVRGFARLARGVIVPIYGYVLWGGREYREQIVRRTLPGGEQELCLALVRNDGTIVPESMSSFKAREW